MVKTRVGNWLVAHPQGISFSFAVVALLFCMGMLLSQAGCQKATREIQIPVTADASAVQAQPAQPAASEKTAPAAPAVSESQPAPATQAQPPAQQQPAAGTPKIEFKAIVQDLGDVGPEVVRTAKFEFKNVGSAPLKVIHVKGCCGSVLRGVKDGQEFGPGENGTLEVEYHTGPYPGPLVRRITMQTNDPDRQTADLSLKANVVYRIEHSPNRLNLFPRKENAGCGPIKLKSTDGKPFSIAGFRATAGTLTAQFDPNVKATEFVLQPKADAAKLTRNPKGSIRVSLTHPECKEVDIPYDVLPEFSITPAQLTLFNVKANEPILRDLWVLSNYDEDFEIESVSSQRGTMKATETRKVPGTAKAEGTAGDSGKTGTRYLIKLEIMPPVMADQRSVLSDILEIKVKGGDTLTVQCRGFYVAR